MMRVVERDRVTNAATLGPAAFAWVVALRQMSG
ncbi:MAG: hypothetical protein QOF27_2838, partial [Gaiellaceae bacterium]|nr:hypothetical protein [Gaiellaceae bacterium]